MSNCGGQLSVLHIFHIGLMINIFSRSLFPVNYTAGGVASFPILGFHF